ncbi:unnamed protein product [Protopolystoma xenopodis]|uniref:Rho-GAP domain-containing protein n=1 Tax=Protopolystoma xenopodis TaxID=117903 RepID=A0A448WFN0_9PLAT|nr:unnamed protein product [Protopolystoma xenopodis]
MDARNLATVIAPNLFASHAPTDEDTHSLLDRLQLQAAFVYCLITQLDVALESSQLAGEEATDNSVVSSSNLGVCRELVDSSAAPR